MFRKILVCTDLSAASDSLVRCVREMREVGVEEVVLAHVLHRAPLAEQALLQQKKSLEEVGIVVKVVTPSGVPAHVLLDLAAMPETSAVVVGSHGKGVVRTTALGSVSAAVLHRVQRPVLLVAGELQGAYENQSTCRNMFSKVLFPTDFSDTAERALDYLGKIAKETGSAVAVMHVVWKKPHKATDAEKQEEAAQYLLESKKRRLQTLGAEDVTVELRHGKPAEEVLARCREGGFTMIVMGTHGKGLIDEVLLGSVADHLARHAAIPILFVPAGA